VQASILSNLKSYYFNIHTRNTLCWGSRTWGKTATFVLPCRLCLYADKVLFQQWGGGEKPFTFRKPNWFIWPSLPEKQCPCALERAVCQLELNCLQGRRHNITVNIGKHCNLLFACNFIWQKQGGWGKRNNIRCAWLPPTP